MPSASMPSPSGTGRVALQEAALQQLIQQFLEEGRRWLGGSSRVKGAPVALQVVAQVAECQAVAVPIRWRHARLIHAWRRLLRPVWK